jgi:flagellar assembly protein FliH
MAAIIKPDSPQYPSGPAIREAAFRLSDMEQQAERYLHAVRGEAAQIIAAARDQARQIQQQAQEAGRKAAEEAVEKILDQKVGQRMATLLPALEQAVQQIGDSRQHWLRHWETAAIGLATRIAERLVRGELARRPEIAATWIAEALQLAAGAGEVTIRLHPEDYATLAGQVERLTSTFLPLAAARLAPDPSISPAGCRVETAFGSIDHQLETQLRRLAEELAP